MSRRFVQKPHTLPITTPLVQVSCIFKQRASPKRRYTSGFIEAGALLGPTQILTGKFDSKLEGVTLPPLVSIKGPFRKIPFLVRNRWYTSFNNF